MKDHFRKTILPNIDKFSLSAQQKQMLRSAATGSSKIANSMTYNNKCLYMSS